MNDFMTKGISELRKPASTVINSTTGNFNFDGDVTIVGNFVGKLNVGGKLTIESDSKATGIINAGNIVVKGKISGKVTVKKRISLLTGSVLLGNLSAEEIVYHLGSYYNGNLNVKEIKHLGISQDEESEPSGKQEEIPLQASTFRLFD